MKLPFLCLAALTALLAAGSPSSAAAPETIRMVDLGASAIHWPTYAALAKGFFTKAGIAIDFISSPSSAAGLLQVTTGSADIASVGFPDALRAIDKGAPIGLLRVEEGPSPYAVYAKAGIHSFTALKGKTVMLGGAKDVTRTYFEQMAFPAGLAPHSYDMVYAGSGQARMSALFSGAVDAAILSPPFSFIAEAAHYALLAAPARASTDLPFTGFAINTDWFAKHRPLVKRFLAAYAQGVDWFYDPAHREEAVDILLKRLPSKRSEAEQSYDFYISHRMFDNPGAVTQATVAGWLRILKAQGDIVGSPDAAKFYSLDRTEKR